MATPGSPFSLSQHPDEHRPEHRPESPVLLAVDYQLGEGAALRVAPELADPLGALESCFLASGQHGGLGVELGQRLLYVLHGREQP
jgi:hypothetical protein